MNQRKSFAVSFVVFASFVPHIKAQTPSTTAPRPHDQASTIAAARRNGPVSVDGKLDEAAWQAATPFTDFRQFDPNEGQPATEKTEARVLIDDDAVYVGMRLYDSQPKLIQSQLARRDESIEGDLVELMFDSYHDHVTGVIFRLSAGGARRDATLAPNGNSDNSWDAVWEGATTIDSLGWTAEFRIPLSQLRYNRNVSDQVWGIQLDRKIARKAELDFFSYTPKNQQQGINRYGHLTGLGALRSTRRAELVPYVLAKNENPGFVAANDPFRKKNSIAPGAGVDLKVGLTSNITLDATINPDFGQVEVDPAVVNLSAFETFFPERRPFFIEGRNIFSFGSMRTQNSSNGYTFFHTRRIGRQPQRSIGGSDVDFVDSPLETTIAAAAKLTGRSRGGWSMGFLDAVTTKEEARIRSTSGIDRTETVEPLANYFIGRMKRDLRQGNTTIGAGLTATNRKLDDDPALLPILRRAAYAGGIDWNHAWANRTYAFDGNIVFTDNFGTASAIDLLQTSAARYLQRPDRETYRRDPTKTSLFGYVAEMTLAKLSGLHWTGTLTYQEYSPTFDINESGFLGSTDMRSIAPLIAYSENRPGKYLRSWAQYLFWNPSWDFDGNMTFNGVGSISVGELPNFWNYFFRLDWRPPVLDPGLTRGGPVAGLSTGYGVQLQVDSDRRKRYTYGLFTSYSWNQAGGNGVNIQPYTTIRPTTALRISFNPTFNRTHSIGQFVTRSVDPLATNTYGTRYVFATLNQKQLAMVTRVDWTFTPTLSLQLFAQPLIAAGDFIDYKEFALPRNFKFNVYGRDAGTIVRNDATDRYTVDPDGSGAAAPFSFGDRDFNQRSLRGNAVLRWEYRPGSALFFVWQQSRSGSIGSGEFDFGRDTGALFDTQPENVFVVKATWWIGR
ncbi:MAG TPA: DUF5916 domain-containing protein [Gemmatimonadaceae bacterium]|nr:DUF5916 domain-containing protein [Gemmatimonadaceae bacterium]